MLAWPKYESNLNNLRLTFGPSVLLLPIGTYADLWRHNKEEVSFFEDSCRSLRHLVSTTGASPFLPWQSGHPRPRSPTHRRKVVDRALFGLGP